MLVRARAWMAGLSLGQWLIGLFGAAVVVGLLVTLGVALGEQSRSQPGVNTLASKSVIDPRPAPDFALTDLEGNPASMSDLRGRVVVLNFFASWCVPCKLEAPVLEEFWEASDPARVAVLGIGLWDQHDDAVEFAETYGVSFPLALDPDGAVGVDYGVAGIPETLIVDHLGVLRARWVGPLTPGALGDLTADLLRESGG